MDVTARDEPRRDWVAGVGLCVVGLAAAVLTFTTLRDLAEACGITGTFIVIPLSWLVPVTVDAAGIVAARVWLRGRAGDDAVVFARTLAWVCIAASVVGNAGQHAMAAYSIRPEWWVVVLVSAVPPATLGAVVHLSFLVSRGGRQHRQTASTADRQEVATATHVILPGSPTGDRHPAASSTTGDAPTTSSRTTSSRELVVGATTRSDRPITSPDRQVVAAARSGRATSSARVDLPGPRPDWMTETLVWTVVAAMRKAGVLTGKRYGPARCKDEHGLQTEHQAKAVMAYIGKHNLLRVTA